MSLKISGPDVNDPANLELVNLATIKAYTQQTSTVNDTILQTLLDNTHRQLYTLLGDRLINHIVGEPWVYILSGGMDALQLPQWPLVSSTASFDIGYALDNQYTWRTLDLLDIDEWYANDEWGIVYLSQRTFWPRGYRNIRATFEAGYGAVPADLIDAVCQWTAVKFQRYALKRWDFVTITKELETVSFRESEIPKEARMILRRYEREASGIA